MKILAPDPNFNQMLQLFIIEAILEILKLCMNLEIYI